MRLIDLAAHAFFLAVGIFAVWVIVDSLRRLFK